MKDRPQGAMDVCSDEQWPENQPKPRRFPEGTRDPRTAHVLQSDVDALRQGGDEQRF